MPRKSKLRTMATSRWLRWAAVRALCLAVPPLARLLNFPVRSVRALDVASKIHAHDIGDLAFPAGDLPQVDWLLSQAKRNDAGDTSTYDARHSPMGLTVATIDDCSVYGRTLTVMHGPDAALVSAEAIAPNWNQAKPELLRTVPASRAVHYVTRSGGHYFHFFANDLLPLLHVLRRFGAEIGEVRIVVGDGSPSFVEAAIAALSKEFPHLGICRLGLRERLNHVRTLYIMHSAITLEWMPVTRAEADDLAALLVRHYALAPSPQRDDRRLFITRGDARLRRLHNEGDLAQALAAQGFETFEPAGDNHPEQITRFREASMVVAVHGAALTNLLFCRPGTLVVELFPSDHVKSTYCWLAYRLGLRYVAVTGTAADFNQGFSVEIDAVVSATQSA